MTTLLVFISYSSKDKELARLLDSSLLAVGVRTFIDERDILIGESFPERLYDGLERASHFLYILSTASITSGWVREELSVAQVKHKQNAGFGILPIIADEVDIPITVRHLRYADFRSWRDRDSYRTSFLSILRSLGVAPRLLGGEDLTWYATASGKLRGLQAELNEIAGLLHGGLAVDLGGHIAEGEFPPHYMAVKWAIRDDEASVVLSELDELLHSAPRSSPRLQVLEVRVQEASRLLTQTFLAQVGRTPPDSVHAFWKIIRSIVAMIEELRGEVEVVLLASVSANSGDDAKGRGGGY